MSKMSWQLLVLREEVVQGRCRPRVVTVPEAGQLGQHGKCYRRSHLASSTPRPRKWRCQTYGLGCRTGIAGAIALRAHAREAQGVNEAASSGLSGFEALPTRFMRARVKRSDLVRPAFCPTPLC